MRAAPKTVRKLNVEARKGLQPPGAFPVQTREKVRYSDTDRQGHVNNVAFSVFFEAGRVELLFLSGKRLNPAGTEFVLVGCTLQLLKSLHWPGEVLIGTRVESLGRSSITLSQAIFQDDRCAALCNAVMVLTSARTSRSVELGKTARQFLARLARA